MSRTAGKQGEDLVARFYERSGYKVVQRNFIPAKGRATGEIDLIVSKSRLLVFVEVKARTSGSFGTGAEAVDAYKQRKIVLTSKIFLSYHQEYADFDLRIDVAEVDIDKGQGSVRIIEDAIQDLN